MMKKMIALLLALMSVMMCAGFGAQAEEEYETKTMYVYTENLGALNVRSEPRARDGNVIGQLQYGDKVTMILVPMTSADWVAIKYSRGEGGVAFVMSRFLTAKKPDMSKKEAEDKQRLNDLEELNRQIATYKPLDKQLKLVTRPPRSSGWMNFRVGPGVAADRIASFPDGRELTAIGETAKWYQVIDDATGKTGYVSKQYVNVVEEVQEQPAEVDTDGKESLGKLNVNGEFALECRLPEGYELQVVNMKNTRIVASVTSKDETKPVMYLSIAYDELYSDTDRMNDMSEEDLKAIEATFTEMNDVEITYRETGYGTKLMVVREKGDDTDFVDIFTVYKGYDVEFNVTPGAGVKELTEEQIKAAVDFLTELDFVEVR